MINKKVKLISLLQHKSKHSQYQSLPSEVTELLYEDAKVTYSKFEKERFDFLKKYVIINDSKVIDIGGNTGYFSFECLKNSAEHVFFVEGNIEHTKFVEEVSKILEYEEKLAITNDYYDFEKIENKKYDIGIVLNVLHHAGDDYAYSIDSIEIAKNNIKNNLQNMSKYIDTLFFQLGFNWKGDPALPLFTTGTKQEMISFIEEGILNHWAVTKIGIPEKDILGNVSYQPKSTENLRRNDSLGEFLNRPLFILKSIYRN